MVRHGTTCFRLTLILDIDIDINDNIEIHMNSSTVKLTDVTRQRDGRTDGSTDAQREKYDWHASA